MAVTLPKDILLAVLEAFVFQFDTKDIIRLLPVSRAVKSWLEPHAYSKVTLKTKDQVFHFSSAVREELPFCRPARHVKQLRFLFADQSDAGHFPVDVIELLSNLVSLAFDNNGAPFGVSCYSTFSNGVLPCLTRLSIHLLHLHLYNSDYGQLILPWKRFIHLHIFGPVSMNDSRIYRILLGHGCQIDEFSSLESMCIDLAYPTLLEEQHLRKLFARLRHLRRVVIRVTFSYPRFRTIWDKLARNMKDEPRIMFEMKELKDQDFYENTIHYPKWSLSLGSVAARHRQLQNTLDGVNSLWDTEN